MIFVHIHVYRKNWNFKYDARFNFHYKLTPEWFPEGLVTEKLSEGLVGLDSTVTVLGLAGG